MEQITKTVPVEYRVHLTWPDRPLSTACGTIPGWRDWENRRGILVIHTGHYSLDLDLEPRPGTARCTECSKAGE